MNRRKPGKEDKPVRILQGAAFVAFMILAGSIEDQEYNLHPEMAVLAIAAAVVFWIISEMRERRKG